MKQLLKNQLLNIVFLMLIVAGALTIYFLSHTDRLGAAEASAVPSETVAAATATPEATASAVPRPRGVPVDVFTTHLATSSLFTASAVAVDPQVYSLSYGESPAVDATLEYGEKNGYISSLELTFPVVPAYDANSDSAIEQYLAASQSLLEEKRQDAVCTLLLDLVPACDANDAISLARVRLWAEEALLLEPGDDAYVQSESGCSFFASITKRGGQQALLCQFFLED